MKNVLLLSFMITYSFAQPLPERSEFFVLEDFSGGLNSQFSTAKKPSNFAENIRNLYIDKTPGSLVRRKGWEIINTTAVFSSKINFMFPFNKENGEKELILSDGVTVLSTKDFIDFTFIRDGLSDLPLQAAQVRDKVWLTNGTNDVFTWDGSTAVVLNGTSGKLNAPKGKYIAYYHERVWLFSILNNKSALRFTSLTSTNGVAIAPDNENAFPSDNQLNIGQGDGQNGTGLFVYRGALFAVKERAIFTIVGDSVFNYFVRKTDSEIGFISQNSIKVLDGLIYGLAKDGLYQFDGNNNQRISDLIAPDIEKINKESSESSLVKWETKADFERGGLFSGSTIPTNSLTLFTTTRSITSIPVSPVLANMDNFALPINTAGVIPIENGTIEDSYRGIPDFMIVGKGANIASFDVEFNIRNNICGKQVQGNFVLEYLTSDSCLDSYSLANVDIDTHIVTAQDIRDRDLIVRFEKPGTSGNGNIGLPWKTYADGNRGTRLILSPATTGQFISNTATFTNVGLWGSFDAVHSIPDGTIKYFIRSSTALNVIGEKAWKIQPNEALIDLSTGTGDLFVQWASTIQSISKNDVPSIQKVVINFFEGTIIDSSIFAEVWKNRYWLSVTTEPTKNFPLIYVKSKITNTNPNAFVKFDNHFIRSFGIFSDNFYAGSSTAGTIIKLDTEFSDNNFTIDSVYETPVLPIGNRFFEKTLSEYIIDTEQNGINGASLKVGVSVDGRAFEDTSFDISGSTRIIKPRAQINKRGKSFRFRIRENSSKGSFVFNSLLGIYQPTDIRMP